MTSKEKRISDSQGWTDIQVRENVLNCNCEHNVDILFVHFFIKSVSQFNLMTFIGYVLGLGTVLS